MTTEPIENVFELLEDARFHEALVVVDGELHEQPDDPDLYAMRALVLLSLERRPEAHAAIDSARGLGPSSPFTHYAAAEVALASGEMADAIHESQAAQAGAPDVPEFALVEARARARAGQWEATRRIAARVIYEDPDNEDAAVLLTAAKAMHAPGPLGDEEWRRLTQQFPTNPWARSGRAWSHLQSGRFREAHDEFAQALALDPSSEWAKQGMVLALKARNPMYALLLRSLLWMGRLPDRTQTALVLGGLLGYNGARSLARTQPELQPILVPLMVAYGLFVLLSWLADPVLNLLLMARPEGRKLLRPQDKQEAVLVGSCLGAASLLLVLALAASWTGGYLAAFGVALSSITVAAAFHLDGVARRAFLAAAAAFVTLSVLSGAVPSPTSGSLVLIAIIGIVLTTWISRALRSKERRTQGS